VCSLANWKTTALAVIQEVSFHDLQHHPGSQPETILKPQAFCHSLKFPYTILITGEQIFPGICHGGKQLFFISANQADTPFETGFKVCFEKA